jgi:hypothetical protein
MWRREGNCLDDKYNKRGIVRLAKNREGNSLGWQKGGKGIVRVAKMTEGNCLGRELSVILSRHRRVPDKFI